MSLKSLMRQTITLYNRSGFDRYGKETVGAGTSVLARVQIVSKVRFHFSAQGSDAAEYVIAAIIYVPSATTVNEGDKITYNSVDYRVHGVTLSTDGQGDTAFKKLECTKWNL